jgi:peptidoglycan/xylan/chitin deacetylase (PgdA/CDA1 family)
MLHTIMYHYVRDLPRTRYPRIKGMLLDDFRQQVRELRDNFEMATLESCLDYLRGRYQPKRDLCLLTFDDGLKEHAREVTEILAGHGIQGVFHVITACSSQQVVVPVHMNHFLMAELDFAEYQQNLLARFGVTIEQAAARVDVAQAQKTYTWDTAEVAAFKYFFNFVIDPKIRDLAVKDLFERVIGPAPGFASELYLNWNEAREMQAAGMSVGGHTHMHRPLSSLTAAELEDDLKTCTRILRRELKPQAISPFCYPYGKSDSYTPETIAWMKLLGYHCGFTTQSGPSEVGQDLYTIPRVDCKKAPAFAASALKEGTL